MVYLDTAVLVASILSIFVFATQRLSAVAWIAYLIGIAFIVFVVSGVRFDSAAFIFTVASITLISILLSYPVRKHVFAQPIFRYARKQKAHISDLEKQALAAGEPGFEQGFFAGKPDWESLRSLSSAAVSPEELAFLDGPINQYCETVDDWDIRSNRKIPDSVWNAAEKHKLSGMRVKKQWGGRELSFQAQTLALSKVASRSVDASILIELPTSLYPDELIEQYGTDEQKKYYLPRLAEGKEIVSFAVTGEQGSDVGGMYDNGEVTYEMFEGKNTLGLKLHFNKRYITFAPKSSLIVLAFMLKDPDNLLKGGEDRGITLAIIPAKHPGVVANKRHYPAGLGFPHGPISGKDVFIPLEWIMGGQAGIGLGWKMIMQCLFVGRCLSLPGISVGTIKTSLRTATAYAVTRRQFGLAINTFEGVTESITKIAEIAYVSEAARSVASALVDSGKRPLAVSSLMKYRVTEHARQAINHSMDIHSGRSICDGPANYSLSGYNAIPIGVAVEGANIVSRSVITYAQGTLHSHPYTRTVLESCEQSDYNAGLRSFTQAWSGHVALLFANLGRSVLHALSFSAFAHAPDRVPGNVSRWYKALSRYTAAYAFLSDVTILLMGPELKKRQKLGGRLADILSELYLLSAVLKRYENDGYPKEDYPVVELAMRNGLHRLEQNLLEAIRNYPKRGIRPLLRVIVFPFGSWRSVASDTLGSQVAELVSMPGGTRDRLTSHMYLSKDPQDPIGRLEVAYDAAIKAQPIYAKIRVAIRAGKVQKNRSQIDDAERLGIITKEEADIVRDARDKAEFSNAVDAFEQTAYVR